MLPVAHLFGGTLVVTAHASRMAQEGQILMSFLTALAIGTGALVLSSFVLTRVARYFLDR